MKLEEFSDNISDEDRLKRMNEYIDEMDNILNDVLEHNGLISKNVIMIYKLFS